MTKSQALVTSLASAFMALFVGYNVWSINQREIDDLKLRLNSLEQRLVAIQQAKK
jgi:hypothetical protein